MLGLLRYGLKVAPWPTILAMIASVVGAAMLVALPVLTGQAIGRLPRAIADGPDNTFIVVAVGVAGTLLVSTLTALVENVARMQLSGILEKDTTLRVGEALSADPDLRTLDNPEVAAKVQKIRGQRWEIEMGVALATGPLVNQVLSLAGSAIALGITFSWWVPIILVAAALIEGERWRRTVVAQFDVWVGNTEEQKQAEYAFEQGMGRAAKETRIFGLGGYLRQRHWDNITAAFQPYWRKRRRQSGANIGIGTGRTLLTAAGIGYAGWQASTGRLDLTGLATTLSLMIAIGGVSMWSIGQVQRGATALGWLNELSPVERAGALLVTREPERTPVTHTEPPTITFDEVSFSYPGQDRTILTDLTLELPAGAATALVGVNGAGKSTLVKLLACAYHPTRGRILIDGVDLVSLDPEERRAWQRRVAPITQDFIRLPLSAGDNVELGTGHTWAGRIDLEDWPDATDLDAVARRAGITDLVDRLAQGWKTTLDKTIKDGTDLSGGEWQRIGLARALRAVDVGARVLVLDEPAAALDVQSEARLVGGYLELAQHVTSLVISHRFSVVRPVPNICVLEHGRIVEHGSHDALMATGGRYSSMFSLQASRYVAAEQPATGRAIR